MEAKKLFKDIPEISEATLKVLESLGYASATPVQEACIPLFTGHKDVAVDACTGSGKTLAFVIPIVEKLRKIEEKLRKLEVGAIIVSPTRELAQQIFQVAEPFLATVPWLKSLQLVGGTDPVADVELFEREGGNVIVATPGRLADVMRRSRRLDVRRLEVLVLDEADRLLDLGFRAQLDDIMGRLPKQRRTGLFSATQTEALEELARAGLRNPVRVKVQVKALASNDSKAVVSQRTPLGLTIHYRICEATQKLGVLLDFLQEHRDQKVIAYTLTCAMVDFFTAALRQLPEARGLAITALHGRMKQSQREAGLAAFSAQKAGCLLSTDVAARGLDIPDVAWILQLEPPGDPDGFVHRVGRTARAGRTGQALLLLLPHEAPYVPFLRLRKVPLEEDERADPAPDLGASLRKLAESDRDVLEKGIRAFVSFVRGYKEHQCKYIFRIQDLDLGKLAWSCGLLQLPRMPEIRKVGGKLASFEPSSLNPNTVQFKDRVKQKAREKKLAEQAREREAALQARAAAGKPPKHVQQEAAKKLPAAKRRILEQRQDDTDFAQEYTMLKRLKRGQITEQEFDVATGLAAGEGASDLSQSDLDSDTDAGKRKNFRTSDGRSSRQTEVKAQPKAAAQRRVCKASKRTKKFNKKKRKGQRGK